MLVFTPFESARIIWTVWIVSLAFSAAGTLWLVFSLRSGRLTPSRLHAMLLGLGQMEDGASYSISYVMVIPLYALFVCTTVETTWMLIAKIGTTRAAFAAARSSIVYASAESLGEQQAGEAAVIAMAPFASGMSSAAGTSEVGGRMEAAARAYSSMTNPPVSRGYVRAKLAYASSSVTTSVRRIPANRPNEPWRDSVAAKVTYTFPFRFGAVGRFLGRSDGSGRYTYPISSTVTLPIETPRNQSQSLGIDWRAGS